MTDEPKSRPTDPELAHLPPPPARRVSLPEGPWDQSPAFDDEEATTRDTDAAIALPPTAPSPHATRATLTVVTGSFMGRTYSVEDAILLGRGRAAQVQLEDAGLSRVHACVRPTPDGGYEVEDLRSLNGTWIDGRRVERVRLQSGDRIHLGPNVVVTFAVLDAQAERLTQQLYESSVRDALTKASNRRYLAERLPSEVAYSVRHRTPLGLILFDVDHFKRINDTHGHLTGDDVLRDLAALVQRLIRAEDIFARYGGEEFVVVVRGIEHDNVGRFAERLRAAVEKLEVATDSGVLRVTVSLGYASLGELGEPARTAEGLLRLADARLYHAKRSGRNRVSGA